MFAVVITFTLKPGTRADFLALIRENASASVRDEPGCHQFDVATDPERPDEVFLYEVYANNAAFQAHKQTRHFAIFDAAGAGMIADKDIRTYSEIAR